MTITELIQHLANATKTLRGTRGEKKTTRLDARRRQLESELRLRGADVPADDYLMQIGTFNGPTE